MKYGNGLASAFHSITRFNFPGKECKDIERTLYFFPIIGLFLALYAMIIPLTFNYYFSNKITNSHTLTALLEGAITTIMLAYGSRGFHLDGLGDTFDGFGGAYKKERILEIMSDSRSGAFSIVAICSTLILKTIGFSILYDRNPLFIILVVINSRTALTFQAYFSKYAKESGLAKTLVDKCSKRHVIVNLTMLFIISLIFINYGYLTNIIVFYIASIYAFYKVRSVAYKKIQGISGDVFGATVEIVETISLCAISLSLLT
ncbi:MAG: adenosylcobinamide-GDP ribazoletransferase [Spirochaetaceae bacterium]|nr:adenosylcobinamide-GDP ribazoletransferase [Spirochaetaceae bacterium]